MRTERGSDDAEIDGAVVKYLKTLYVLCVFLDVVVAQHQQKNESTAAAIDVDLAATYQELFVQDTQQNSQRTQRTAALLDLQCSASFPGFAGSDFEQHNTLLALSALRSIFQMSSSSTANSKTRNWHARHIPDLLVPVLSLLSVGHVSSHVLSR